MKKALTVWQTAGFFITTILGVLLHFLFDWTDQSRVAALISGINESTWEHMKLLFFPLFIFALTEGHFVKDRDDFWCVKLIGTLVGVISIPILFYTLNGAFAKTPDWLNITLFFVSAALAFITEGVLFKKGDVSCAKKRVAIAVFLVITAAFFVFTFYPPKLLIFKDPVTNEFGYYKTTV